MKTRKRKKDRRMPEPSIRDLIRCNEADRKTWATRVERLEEQLDLLRAIIVEGLKS